MYYIQSRTKESPDWQDCSKPVLTSFSAEGIVLTATEMVACMPEEVRPEFRWQYRVEE